MPLKDHIQNGDPWSRLPAIIRSQLHNDPKEYGQQIMLYSMQNQLKFRGNPVQHVIKERKYYEKLVEFSRQNHFLYPYHLQDKLVPGLQITPFIYYRDMLIDTVRRERSYDCIPNFTAADCLRLLGIGRNQFIEIVNTYKNFLQTATAGKQEDLHEILFEILPDAPLLTINFEPWYVIRVGAILMEDIENCSSAERKLIDRIIDSERAIDNSHLPRCRGLLIADTDVNVVRHLYRRGLVYLEVPVCETDRFGIPTLEGFVMNRVNGDTRENLLYKIFVSIDSGTTIHELADCLKIDTELVSQAASIFCRLGFAYKKVDSTINQYQIGSELRQDLSESLRNLSISAGLRAPSVSPSLIAGGDGSSATCFKKLAVIFDSTLIAYLMMGNLSSGLKPHAVTMFEVGKLSDDALLAFISELDNLSSIDEGEGKVYYEHALNLREAIHYLRNQAHSDMTDFQDIDLIRGGSLLALEWDVRIRILQKKYSMIISLSPVTREDRLASNVSWPGHIGPPIPEINSPWFQLYIIYLAYHNEANGTSTCAESPLGSGEYSLPLVLLTRGSRLSQLPDCFYTSSRFQLTAWEHNPVTVAAGSLLTSASDMALLSPVLIQSVDAFQPCGNPLAERYIPLPLSRGLISPTNRDRLPGFLVNLLNRLDLTALTGYLTVMTVPGNTGSETTRGGKCSHSSGELVLSDIELVDLVSRHQPFYLISLHLGLPIFNSELLHAVCQRMTDSEVLTVAQRPNLDSVNRRLVAGLKLFIRLACCRSLWPLTLTGGDSLVEADQSLHDKMVFHLASDKSDVGPDSEPTAALPAATLTLPTRNLIFAQGSLREFT